MASIDFESTITTSVDVTRLEITDVVGLTEVNSEIEMCYDLNYLFRTIKVPWIDDSLSGADSLIQEGVAKDIIGNQTDSIAAIRQFLQGIFCDLRNKEHVSVANQTKIALANLLGGVNSDGTASTVNQSMMKLQNDESIISYIPKRLVYKLYEQEQWETNVISEGQLVNVLHNAAIRGRGSPLMEFGAPKNPAEYKFQFVDDDTVRFNMTVHDDDQGGTKENRNTWQFVLRHTQGVRTHVAKAGTLTDPTSFKPDEDFVTQYQVVTSGNVFPVENEYRTESVTMFSMADGQSSKKKWRVTIRKCDMENVSDVNGGISDYLLFNAGAYTLKPEALPYLELTDKLKGARKTLSSVFQTGGGPMLKRPFPQSDDDEITDGLMKIIVADEETFECDDERLLFTHLKEHGYDSPGMEMLVQLVDK